MDREIVKRAQESADAMLADAKDDSRNILDNASIDSKNMRLGSLNYADELLNNTGRGMQNMLEKFQSHCSSLENFLLSEIDSIQKEREELAKFTAEEKRKH